MDFSLRQEIGVISFFFWLKTTADVYPVATI